MTHITIPFECKSTCDSARGWENSSRCKNTKVGGAGIGVFDVDLASLGALSVDTKHILTFTHTKVNPPEATDGNFL